MSWTFKEWFKIHHNDIDAEVGCNEHLVPEDLKEIFKKAYDAGYCKGKDDEFDETWVGE